MEARNIVFDTELIRRYDRVGPRYTSYPTAAQFREDFNAGTYRALAARTNIEHPQRPLSLYLHLPFCATVCFYCACNKIVTRNRGRAAPYLEDLKREIALQGELFGGNRVVEQLHWGGGTPTFISPDEMCELMQATRRHFRLYDNDRGEYSIEIDPREVRGGTLRVLRSLGFNRLSLGVQDFDPAVQHAVNRKQGEDQTLSVLSEARALGFRSINMDLIYGLPRQTVDSFSRTLDKVVTANPDRLSVFSYAHLPAIFKTQRQIRTEELPNSQTRLELLQLTIERLTQAGYVYIGMDHFARAGDELAVAQRNGTLHRNFQGYSTHAHCDLIGMGVTAIGRIGSSYSQNHKTMPEYSAAIAKGELPVLRGVTLTDDDQLRRAVIAGLICHFRLDLTEVERRFGIKFDNYFSRELAELTRMQGDGLLRVSPKAIIVEPRGKLLIRNICMVFDAYLRQAKTASYSKVI